MARKNSSAQEPNNVCFEEALGKLELIVKQLEKGELNLEDSLDRFAQGVALSQICLAKLNAAEERITKILQEDQGRLIEKPLIFAKEGGK